MAIIVNLKTSVLTPKMELVSVKGSEDIGGMYELSPPTFVTKTLKITNENVKVK
jgi:hypothetical protein